MRVDQDMAMRLYSQPTQTRNASAVAAAADKQVTDAAANKDAEKKPDVDRVELSNDAKVTSKMSDSERAALVKSLKDDLRLNPFSTAAWNFFIFSGSSPAIAAASMFYYIIFHHARF